MQILVILSASILTGFLASSITIYFTRKNLKTVKYIDTITNERIKWIETMRNDFANLISSVLIHLNNTDNLNNMKDEIVSLDNTDLLTGAYREKSDEELQYYSSIKDNISCIENVIKKSFSHNEIVSHALLIKLKLNPINDTDLIKDIDKIIDFFSNCSKETKEIDIDFNSTVEKIQKLLKIEWDKVKLEVNNK